MATIPSIAATIIDDFNGERRYKSKRKLKRYLKSEFNDEDFRWIGKHAGHIKRGLHYGDSTFNNAKSLTDYLTKCFQRPRHDDPGNPWGTRSAYM